MVVIHYAADSTAEGTMQTLEDRGLSIHYILDKDGSILSSANTDSSALVDEDKEAWHAGCSRKGEDAKPYCHSNTEKPDPANYEQDEECCMDVNSRSIGIEIVNLGDVCGSITECANGNGVMDSNGIIWEKYPSEQISVLETLVAGIVSRYDIPVDREHIVGHEEIAPGYKVDPGPLFPWIDFMNYVEEHKTDSEAELGRSFYVIDKQNNPYVVKILPLIGKGGKSA